ncbi:tetratricopeptide repeat protein [Candidatus Poribacteria bacterium]|nr:tetratricopeptide repeat protein [Candidatus Poribacteria bacterium]
MPWPSRRDYAQAVDFFPHISILDPELRGGTSRRGANNSLIPHSGGFSIVFPIEGLSNTYALRCWIADIGDAETRYRAISDYLKQRRLPYFVDFEYVPNGIMVNGDRYPITRMEWAEGETLCDFIEHNLQDARCLKTAAVEFQKMVAALHAHQISHGDLQDGNILLKRSGTDVEIKLIDYDSLFVPALRNQPDSLILGFPEYQHPQRIAGGGITSEKVDYFSELVIYLSLLSLAEKPDLWSQFGIRTERGFLFTAEDFKNLDQSDVFRELENLSPDVKQLASKLKEFCKLSLNQLKPLEAVLPKTSPAQVAYNQGLTYLRNNRHHQAMVEFDKAIGLDPNYKEAYHGLGLAHFKISNFAEAKRAAEAALGIDPHYQPAIQLLDVVIKSSGNSSVVPPTVPPSSPPQNPSDSIFLQNVLGFWQLIAPNLWQYMTGALAFILLICIVVLSTQISARDEALRQIEALTDQQVKHGLKLNATTSSIRTLSNENAQFLRENQRLQNQLTKQDEATKTQIAIAKQLRSEKEGLRGHNRKLRNQLAEQDKETKNQITIARREKEELHSQNQTLRNEKEQLHSQNQELRNENTMLQNQLKLDATTSSIQTLSNEKAKLLRENQKLRNQLTEQDKATKAQIAIAKQLRSEKEELHSQNQKLHKENTALQKRLDELTHDDVTAVPIPRKNQLPAAPPKKISNNIIRQVTLGALSKNNQGYFAFKENQHSKAIDLFEDAKGNSPKSAVIHYNLGCTYLAIKEYIKSVNCFQKAVGLDPGFKEANYNLALSQLRRGYHQEAIKAAQAALNIDRNYQPALQLLAAIE